MAQTRKVAVSPQRLRIDQAVDRLRDAARLGIPCAPVRDLIGSNDLVAAYSVQERVSGSRLSSGATVVGRKIGLTSAAIQEQLGVTQPDFGILFDDMAYVGGDVVPLERFLQPRVEAEIAFMLAADLAEGALDIGQIRDAIAYAVTALEVCDSRIADWDISFGDTVADNASSGAFVLGPIRRSLDLFEPREVSMRMTIDGKEASYGDGTACMGDPLRAVQWLAKTARDLGEPLRAGQVILSGALGPMRPVSASASVMATISGLGSVSVRFEKGAAA